jgi:acyl-CoA synthetase (NDP forming)/RimJ/RimL family protein N-acetyltransferase
MTLLPSADLGWDVLLRDGRIARVRPFVADDEASLLDLNERVSDHTRLMRYFSVGDRPGRWYVEHLIQQAALGNALVAVVDDEVVAVASYARLEADPGTADLGLMVDDRHQASGLGALLLEHLAHGAREHGIRAFHADVLGENHQMLRLLRSSGFSVTGTTGGGVVELTVDLAESEAVRNAASRREIVAERASLRRVLAPESVAVVGSARSGSIARRVVSAAHRFGYSGLLSLVDQPHGLSGPVDLVVVAVPSEQVLDVAQDAADAGAAGIVVLSAGFAESGEEGALRQDALLALCRSSGMRLVGPNCLGLLNTEPGVQLNATFCEATPAVGGVALVSQSGAVGMAALRDAERRRTGLSLFVSTGNKADVSGNDLLEYLAEDERTTVVGMYLESFGNPRKFLRVAGALGRTKPVVVVKAGRTSAGEEAGRSHTAGAATPEVTTQALLRAAGAIRADDMAELFDLVTLLSSSPLPAGPRVAVLGNSGGAGVLAVDAVVTAGLTVASLAPATEKALRRVVPDCASVQNPVDLLATVTPRQLHDATALLLHDPGVDAVITLYTPASREQAEPYAEALVAASAQRPEVPVLTTFPGLAVPPYGLARTQQPDLPFFAYPEHAARALAKALEHARWRAASAAQLVAEPEPPLARTPMVERLLVTAADGRRWLAPDEVSVLLHAAGVPEVASMAVTSAAEAVRAASELGYPVVLKAHGPDLVHKADRDAVVLDLRDAGEVTDAWDDLRERLGDDMVGGLVQRRLATDKGLELLAGAYVDPVVGPLVLAGLGGTLTDILDDRVLRVPPRSRDEALLQLQELRCAPALCGFRGIPPLAVDAAADVLVGLGRLLDACPEIREVDLNPVLLTAAGAWVLDARIAVAPVEPESSAPFRSLRPPVSRRQS